MNPLEAGRNYFLGIFTEQFGNASREEEYL